MNKKLQRLINPIIHALFWIGFGAAFWGAFEMAFQAAVYAPNTSSAVWSGTFGPPFFHHYIYGFILVGVAWITYHLLKFSRTRREKKTRMEGVMYD